MKLMMQTTGEFMLLCPYSGQIIEPGRPHVVTPTEFFQDRIARGQLRVVGRELPDEATDKDFAAWWQESPETAVEGYPTSFEGLDQAARVNTNAVQTSGIAKATPEEKAEKLLQPKKGRKKKAAE